MKAEGKRIVGRDQAQRRSGNVMRKIRSAGTALRLVTAYVLRAVHAADGHKMPDLERSADANPVSARNPPNFALRGFLFGVNSGSASEPMSAKGMKHMVPDSRMRICLLALIGTTLFSTGCATAVSQRKYEVTIDNSGGPTHFAVHDHKNNVIHEGMTPHQVTLNAKKFPFWPAKYNVSFSGQQNQSQNQIVKAGFDPWVAGNLVFGGVAGLVIDGASGAMFRLPKRVVGSVPNTYAVNDQPQIYEGRQSGEQMPVPAPTTLPENPVQHVNYETIAH